MLFEITSSAEKFWQQRLKLEALLFKYAQTPLINQQNEKELFLKKTHHQLEQFNWDSIHGACYQLSDDHAVFSLLEQVELSRFLFSASITFFDGELNHLGNQLLNAIVQFLWDEKDTYFHSRVTFQLKKVPCIVSGKELLENLEEEEIALLLALTDHENYIQNQDYWVKYQNSLFIAAKKAEMEYKQAQILENLINNKLVRLSQKSVKAKHSDNLFHYEANTAMLSLIAQVILWHKKTICRDIIDQLVSKIKNQLESLNVINQTEEIIYICHSFLDYCQISFNLDLVKLVYQKIMAINLTESLSDKAEYQLNEIVSVLTRLSEQIELFDKSELLYRKKHLKIDTSKKVLDVYLLDSSSQEDLNQKQRLLSCYNPYLKLYQLS